MANAKHLLMTAAEELFFQYGFKRVSVNEICKKANCSRKTFYSHFANKQDIVVAVLDNSFTHALARYKNVPEDLSFGEKMEQVIQIKFEFSQRITMQFLSDLYDDSYKQIAQYLQRVMTENDDWFRQMISEGQKKGEVFKDLNIDIYIYLIYNLQDFYKRKEFMDLFKNSRDMIKQLSKLLIYGIVCD